MRVPPHSIEAEQSLLGGVLLAGDAFEEIASEVKAEDFYRESHRHIFRSIEVLVSRGEAVDVMTLTQQLRDETRLEAVGGLGYIAELSRRVPTAANITYYAGLVKKKSILRKIISLSGELTQELLWGCR